MSKAALTVFIALIVTFELLAAKSITTNSIVVDEFAHLPAGVAYWRDGMFSMYDENPPLIRYLISAPAFARGAKMDYTRVGSSRGWEWAVSQDFRRVNSTEVGYYFLAARTVIAGLSVGCGLLLFLWTKKLNGVNVALISIFLWFLDPNVIAHSTVATTDIGRTFFGLLASFFFWRYLEHPSVRGGMLSGIGLGLALGSKFSMTVLLPAWILGACVHLARSHRGDSNARRPHLLDLAAILILSLLTLNVLYQFRGTPTSLSSIPFVSPAFSGMPKTATNGIISGNLFDHTWIGRIPLPIPRDFFIGLDSQLLDQQAGSFGNLERGKLVPDCPWHAPLRTLAYKLPLGTLILAGCSLTYWLYHATRRCFPNSIIVAVPFLFLLLSCAEGGSLKSSLRYSLPALPFMLILMGRPLQKGLTYRTGRMIIYACLVVNIISLMKANPSYIAYGNELVGGHSGAQQRLLGSNFDWGQDLFLLKQWSDRHPELGPIALTYYGPLHPLEVGLNTRPLPESFSRPNAPPSETWNGGFYWAISSNVLHGLPGLLDVEGSTIKEGILKQGFLTKETAIAHVGGTLFLFRVYPEGVSKPAGELSMGMLAGCIRPLGPNDLIAAP